MAHEHYPPGSRSRAWAAGPLPQTVSPNHGRVHGISPIAGRPGAPSGPQTYSSHATGRRPFLDRRLRRPDRRPEPGRADRRAAADRRGAGARRHRAPTRGVLGGGQLGGDRQPSGRRGGHPADRASGRSVQQEARPRRGAPRRGGGFAAGGDDVVAGLVDRGPGAAGRVVRALSDLRGDPARRTARGARRRRAGGALGHARFRRRYRAGGDRTADGRFGELSPGVLAEPRLHPAGARRRRALRAGPPDPAAAPSTGWVRSAWPSD